MKNWLKKYRLKMLYQICAPSLCILLAAMLLFTGCSLEVTDQAEHGQEEAVNKIPEAADASAEIAYIVLNNNVPEFSEDEITAESFEEYSKLDTAGRCGPAVACVGTDLMPTEKRGNISRVKPTGWHSDKYDCVEGGNLYNRCHLIGYQLSGENANERNLITGTRYMNVGMIPFEEMVADYVKETNNHVMYRVTPVFKEDNLIADGVQMEALSVEDKGKAVSYNVYFYNIQPGIEIDYATGESWETGEEGHEDGTKGTYVLNTNTMKFHLPSCSSADQIQSVNKENFQGKREKLIEQGYSPCGSCNP